MSTDRAAWVNLFVKVLLYYLALLLGLIVLLLYVPALEPYLPVGGLDQLDTGPSFEEVVSTYREVVASEKVFRGVYRLMEGALMSLAIGLTLVTMVPVIWVYRATHALHGKKPKDPTVLETLVVLPVIITAIVLIIQNSIALAFGLAGIVAGVQYRNRLALSVDAAYLFAAIAVGIASGIKAVGVGIVMSMWFCLTMIGLQIREASRQAAAPPETTTERLP